MTSFFESVTETATNTINNTKAAISSAKTFSNTLIDGVGKTTQSIISSGPTIMKTPDVTVLGNGMTTTELRERATSNNYVDSEHASIEHRNSLTTPERTENLAGNSSFTYYQYPESIGGPTYPHYVNIYINANSKSKIVKDATASNDASKTIDLSKGDTKLGPNNTGTQQQNTSKMVSAVSEVTNRATTGTATAIGNAIGTVTGGASPISKESIDKLKIDSFSTSFKRLKTAIALPLPNDISAKYGADYKTLSTGGILGSIFQGIAEGKSLADAGTQAVKDVVQSNVGNAIKAAGTFVGGKIAGADGAKMAGGLIDEKTVQDIANKAAGVATNDRLEQAFKQMNFRKFSFDYTFAPRSHTEMMSIQKIIKTLKTHMHPEKGEGGAFLIIPDEFDIEFRFRGGSDASDKRNDYLHVINTCALENVHVTNTSNGQFSSFVDGAPVIIGLRLDFVELTPLVREDIEGGA